MIELLNGVSEDFIKKSQSINIGSDQKFIVLYSGNMGLAQDLKTIVKAADLLSRYDIYFQFIGEGVCKSELEIFAKPFSEKINFHNSTNRDELIKLIKKSSVCLVPLKNKKLFNSALPSKMFEYMACARPIIVGIKGEAAEIVINSKSGTIVEPENATLLSETIIDYYLNRDKCIKHGSNGIYFVKENLKKEKLISRLIKSIKKVES